MIPIAVGVHFLWLKRRTREMMDMAFEVKVIFEMVSFQQIETDKKLQDQIIADS